MDEQWDDDEDNDLGKEATIPCPHCKHSIHEDSVRCPYCENYISQEDTVPARKPWWIYAGAVLALYVVYRWIAG